jgi:hypothetical protein
MESLSTIGLDQPYASWLFHHQIQPEACHQDLMDPLEPEDVQQA